MKSEWLVLPRNDRQAKLRLFCFPYAGAGAAVFRTWSHTLSDQVSVCPVQLPGREYRLGEPAFRSLPALVAALLPELLYDKPFALCGHSMGGLIAFEVARALRRNQSKSPLHLFVSGRRAPQEPPLPPVYQGSDADFVALIRRYGGTPEVVMREPELMEMAIRVLRADFELLDTHAYVPEAPLDVPITAGAGELDQQTSLDSVAAWGQQTSREFKLHRFSDGHFFINTSRELYLARLDEELRYILK